MWNQRAGLVQKLDLPSKWNYSRVDRYPTAMDAKVTSILLSWRARGGAPLQDQLPVISREQLASIMFGTVFVFLGLAACAFAAVRRREEVRLFAWLGTWSAMYGGRLLAESPAVVDVLPQWIQFRVPFVWTVIVYLVVPVATLAWLELSIGRVQVFLKTVLFLSAFIGTVGIAIFVITGSRDKLLSYNNLLAAVALLVLVVVVSVPQLSRKFLVLPNRAVESEAHIHNNFRKYPRYCHLYMIGVLPEAQGKGLASTLMNPMLQSMKEKSIPVFLETANLRNVDIYKKKGFKIFETLTIRDHNVFLMSIES
jgi:ribosomal protein S18 acetylase RimI-like enzyme